MADERQLKILSKGVEVWNEWWSEGVRSQSVDRSDANLSRADLSGANLSRADLSGADLSNANLSGADLSNADLSRADLSRAYLSDAHLFAAGLKAANLMGAHLRGADLGIALLQEAKLVRADLFRADLSGANLLDADLTEANLMSANLTNADLCGTVLRSANLLSAILCSATLSGAEYDRPLLGCADFSGALIGETVLGGLNLSEVQGLEEVKHQGPSRISTDTLYRSRGKIPDIFLRGCGVPENLLSYLPSLVSASAIDFYSCFISYSHTDQSFARRLHNDLQAQGIRCWLDEHQVLPGDDIMAKVDEGIRIWDKVLLCCSEASLTSWWVASEIDSAFAKERQLMRREKGKRVLSIIPLNLDGYLFSGKWESAGREVQIKQRHAPDFRGWESDNAKYEAQLERVVAALRTDGEGRGPKPVPKLYSGAVEGPPRSEDEVVKGLSGSPERCSADH